MAWETRKRGTRYYTRSLRVAGQVVRQYVGCGELGALAERCDGKARARREGSRRRMRDLHQELMRTGRAVEEEFRQIERVLRAALEAAGYHRHARGEWRRQRGRKKIEPHGEEGLDSRGAE